jgi:Cdc6-like AAA superfamily ATPase
MNFEKGVDFMYLSVENCYKLDRVVKSFEVAYRSYVSEKLINKFPSLESFTVGIRDLNNQMGHVSVIGITKIKGKIKEICNNEERRKELYDSLNYCFNCLQNKDYVDHNVPYVSQVIDFIFFFFSTDFIELKDGFETIEEFMYMSVKFHKIRNSLSHPASSRVYVQDMEQVSRYIKRVAVLLDDKYFWYESKRDIFDQIDSLFASVKNPIKIHNLNEISFTDTKVVCRENLINKLKDLIIGKEGMFRRSGSVVIYGYGGVGKTALTLEFIKELQKDIVDGKVPTDYRPEFIVFFTAKEEKLVFLETTGELKIEQTKKQVSTFKEIKDNLYSILQISKWQEFKSSGLVIIDNIETLSQEDKKNLIGFIRESPRSVQYLLTSRNEEECEDRIPLLEFDTETGCEFVKKYIEENELNVYLTDEEIVTLVDCAKGNTLILVLSLLRLDKGKTSLDRLDDELNNSRIVYDEVTNELKSVSSQNLEAICNFMYKNTFEQTLSELNHMKLFPDEVLKVISLYNEPVDLFSISLLSNLKVGDVEKICNMLSQKLILEKHGELYEINEFANKYVLAKFIPNLHEQSKLKSKINETKSKIKNRILQMEEKIEKVPLLKTIMQDWKPKNYIDKISISQGFGLYSEAEKALRSSDYQDIMLKLGKIEQQMNECELMTSHPYIRFQKARIYKLMLENNIIEFQGKDVRKLINEYFEQTIITVEYGYGYIKRTKSFASVLWLFGMFLFNNQDYQNSTRRLEESKVIFEAINILDKTYQQAVLKLCEAYLKMYETTKDQSYYVFSEETYNVLTRKPIHESLRGYKNLVHRKIKAIKTI